MVDAAEGVLGLEWIDGRSVRFLLGGGAEDEDGSVEGDEFQGDIQEIEEDTLKDYGVSQGRWNTSPTHSLRANTYPQTK